MWSQDYKKQLLLLSSQDCKLRRLKLSLHVLKRKGTMYTYMYDHLLYLIFFSLRYDDFIRAFDHVSAKIDVVYKVMGRGRKGGRKEGRKEGREEEGRREGGRF